MNPQLPATTDRTQREFEDELIELETHATEPPGLISQLLARFNAGLADPSAQTVGEFAQTLQAIQAELQMMAGHFGMPVEPQADVDWAGILAAADAITPDAQDLGEFTAEQLTAMHPLVSQA